MNTPTTNYIEIDGEGKYIEDTDCREMAAQNAANITTINAKIPASASASNQMATAADIAVTSGTPTYKHAGIDYMSLKKQGRVAVLSISFDATSLTAFDWSKILEVPDGFKPIDSIFIGVGNASNYGTVATLYPDGALQFYKNNVNQGQYCYINATWITA